MLGIGGSYLENLGIGLSNIAVNGVGDVGMSPLLGTKQEDKVTLNPGESDVRQAGKLSSPAECKTCKERKYQDGSNEMVSFKSASHLSPTEAPSAVRAHEGEHVSNAYKKAEENNGKVLRASVTIHTAICPECGRTYVSGGETNTQIKYNKDIGKNPYEKNRRAIFADALTGYHFDVAS